MNFAIYPPPSDRISEHQWRLFKILRKFRIALVSNQVGTCTIYVDGSFINNSSIFNRCFVLADVINSTLCSRFLHMSKQEEHVQQSGYYLFHIKTINGYCYFRFINFVSLLLYESQHLD
jgi:hypothetical protein